MVVVLTAHAYFDWYDSSCLPMVKYEQYGVKIICDLVFGNWWLLDSNKAALGTGQVYSEVNNIKHPLISNQCRVCFEPPKLWYVLQNCTTCNFYVVKSSFFDAVLNCNHFSHLSQEHTFRNDNNCWLWLWLMAKWNYSHGKPLSLLSTVE